MKRNVALRMAIFETGKTITEVAKESKVHRSLLSMATTGRYILDDEQKERVAAALGKPVDELFED